VVWVEVSLRPVVRCSCGASRHSLLAGVLSVRRRRHGHGGNRPCNCPRGKIDNNRNRLFNPRLRRGNPGAGRSGTYACCCLVSGLIFFFFLPQHVQGCNIITSDIFWTEETSFQDGSAKSSEYDQGLLTAKVKEVSSLLSQSNQQSCSV